MVDNVQINKSKSAGSKIATDCVNKIQHQRVKVEYGGDGTATDVSKYNPLPVDFEDISHDAFGRHRVSNPLTVFEVQHQYNKQPLIWSDTIVGGSIVHLPNESSVKLSTTTASGDKVTRETKRHLRYLPGKSQQILLTGVMGSKKENVIQRIGYFNNNDGILFEQDQNNLSVVIRTSTSGSVVNNSVAQSSWNIDPLNGTGPSGLTIDTSKIQIFVIDFQWLGAGRVRFGVNINGKTIPCHESMHANVASTVYMKTPNLPISYEIENTGVVASTTDMIQICSSVISEGGLEREGFPFTANNGTTEIAITTRRAILSIRKAATFNSINNTALVAPKDFSVLSSVENILYEIVLGGTITDASWLAVDDDSIVEKDTTGTTVTGGKIIASGYVPADSHGNQSKPGIGEGLLSKLTITNSDSLSIVVTSISGATTNVVGSLEWNEVY